MHLGGSLISCFGQGGPLAAGRLLPLFFFLLFVSGWLGGHAEGCHIFLLHLEVGNDLIQVRQDLLVIADDGSWGLHSFSSPLHLAKSMRCHIRRGCLHLSGVDHLVSADQGMLTRGWGIRSAYKWRNNVIALRYPALLRGTLLSSFHCELFLFLLCDFGSVGDFSNDILDFSHFLILARTSRN